MYRYLVVRIAGEHAGEIAHRNIRLTNVKLTIGATWWLNGVVSEPDAFTLRDARGDLILERWGVAIWAIDEYNIIRGGGILASIDPITGDIQCMGYTGYPKQLHYRGAKAWANADPIALTHEMWDYVQSVAGSPLGASYDNTIQSPVRIGTSEEPIGMYWWEMPNIGDTIDDWASQTPFQYTESHVLHSDDTITHRIEIGYPSLGGQRNDLRFATGENIVGKPTITASADSYASDVFVLGPGEGDARLLGRNSNDSPTRIRRDIVDDRADLTTKEALDAEARRLWYNHQEALVITSIQVTNHPNAPVGSWSYGDRILVEISTPTVKLKQWRKVASTEISPEAAGPAVLALEGP